MVPLPRLAVSPEAERSATSPVELPAFTASLAPVTLMVWLEPPKSMVPPDRLAVSPEPVRVAVPPVTPEASPAVSLLPETVKVLALEPASTVPEVKAAVSLVPRDCHGVTCV